MHVLQWEIANGRYSAPVTYQQHDAAAAMPFCLAPFRRLHVAYNGDVLYCTDFYDFKADNVRNSELMAIFNNQRSEKFCAEIAA